MNNMKNLTLLSFLIFLSYASFATPDKKTLRLRVSAPGGYLDETNIYFDLGVSPVYVSNEDGPKVYNSIPNAPSVYSLSSDNIFCSTNGFSTLSNSEIIALGVKADTTGIHTFSAPIITDFDSTTIILLEDRSNNSFTNLRTDIYQFLLNDQEVAANRFYLHVSRPIDFVPVTAGCNNNDGAIQLNQDNAVVWTSSSLYDSSGAVVNIFSNVSGSYSFTGLAAGEYDLVLNYGTYVTTKKLYVSGNYIVASIQPLAYTIAANQEIVFRSTANNTTYYEWNMGDSTIIGGVANPAYTYYQPGIFKVVLKCTNQAGCEYTDSVTVTVSQATGLTSLSDITRKIWSDNNNVIITVNEELVQGAELKIYNLLGQPVFASSLTEATTIVSMPEQPDGYYIVALNNNKLQTTKKVFVANK
jgi:PKD repeat protein